MLKFHHPLWICVVKFKPENGVVFYFFISKKFEAEKEISVKQIVFVVSVFMLLKFVMFVNGFYVIYVAYV